MNYEVFVPSGAELKIKGCNGKISVTGIEGAAEISNSNGLIECRDTSGKMDVTNSNGKITFHKPRGPIKAHSTNGSININEVQLEYITSDICCKTSNGGIRISLPYESQYEVDATHVNGKFECDFPITIEEKSRGHIRGRVGEGGPKVRLSTVNGSISIERI